MKQKHSPIVVVGLSGGVDSSVCALLLKKQGFDVQGLFMKNWEEDDSASHCSAQADLQDVKSVCNKLHIPLHTINFAQEYWEKVFSHFLDEYRKGRTPNPDILCNKEIKFKAFLEKAIKLGADFIAMGHYVQKNEWLGPKGQHYQLLKGFDKNKDQSYFLYTLNQKQLSKSLFPIGGLEKASVRKLAKEAGLITYNKKDSTGICFIGKREFKTFLQDFLLTVPGAIQTVEGKNIGQHDGLMYYTLGQRRGLKIGGQKDCPEKPWYVVGKNLKTNILFVTQQETHPWHYCSKIILSDFHFIDSAPIFPFEAKAKIRYRQEDQSCIVTANNLNQVEIEFLNPQKGATPGQSLVLYHENVCLGGGIIQQTNSLGGIIPKTDDFSARQQISKSFGSTFCE